MNNILTIDLEEWFHANYHDDVFSHNQTYETRVVKNTQRLLELFDRYGAKATFFVLGYVAEKHPELILQIKKQGHEIASHGYAHELVYKQTTEEFREDLLKSLTLIEEITGSKTKGFRAPSWSITENSLWAWEVLEELGLAYDASVFPIQTFLYGLPSSPRFAYHPNYQGKTLNLLEVPSSTVQIMKKNIPFAGGFYFRALPYTFIARGIDRLNQSNQPAIVYLHPREIDPGQPKLSLSFKEHLIHYYGINSCERKLIKLLKKFNFTTIENFYL